MTNSKDNRVKPNQHSKDRTVITKPNHQGRKKIKVWKSKTCNLENKMKSVTYWPSNEEFDKLAKKYREL